jgi:hypothetical protein
LGERGGGARRPPNIALLGILAVTALALFGSGCGGSDEVSEGAEVHVYAAAALCGEAKAAASGGKGDVGGVKVRVRCLPPSEGRGGVLDLAAIGAGARGAVQDSSSVAVIESRGRSTSFSRPILDEAEVALVADRSGAKAMTRVLSALDSRGGEESPRTAVWEELAG